MLNSKTLSGVLKDPKKTLFHSKDKINFTFSDIEVIDNLPKFYHKIDKLHLSHNKIAKLSGIEQFKHITHLSLSYNQIKDWEELLKIENKEALVELNIKGNPLTAHPNHLFLIVERFPNLQRIDDLKISNEDRFYLQNYKQLSGKILPFYIQVKDDLAIIEENLKRMKITAEIRQRDGQMNHQKRKQNKEKLEDLYYKMMQDLKNNQIFVEIHRILEKYTRFQSQSPTLTLRIIDNILNDIYEKRLEHLKLDQKTLETNYRKLFNDMMLYYFSQQDTSIDRFLTQQVLDNSFYDHWRFAEDNDYAFNCVLHEFSKLMPNQVSRSHKVNFSFDANAQTQEQEKIATTQDDDSDFLKNICVTHFPLFPLNLQYSNMILKMLLSQMEAVENLAVDIYLLLDSNSPILKNLGNYRLFIESKMQTARPRSQTPPSHRDHCPEEEIPVSARSKRQVTSVPPSKIRRSQEALGSPNSRFGMLSSGRIEGNNQFVMGSTGKTKMFSPTNIFLDSNAQTRVFGSGDKYLGSKTRRSELENTHTSTGKRRNVLPLLMIVKLEANEKVQLKEGFHILKEYFKASKKVERKAFVEEICETIKIQRADNLKAQILQQWSQRAQSKSKLLAVMKEVRYRKMERYFRLLWVGCRRSRQEMQFYYVKSLSLKVFYSILHIRMKKKASLKKILDNLVQKRNRIANLYLSKWRLINSALKYSVKKSTKMTTNKSLSKLPTMKRRPSSSDPRKYKELKEEAARLQTKKTMRELEPYFAKDKSIFRGCSTCDYDI